MMNFINRMLVVIELLIAIAFMPILIVLLLFSSKPLADFVTRLAGGLANIGPNAVVTQLICVGLSALVFIIAILFLFLELQRSAIQRLKVQEVMGGQVEVTVDAIVHRLEHAISQIADVTRVRPRVVATKKGNVVDLALDVETDPDVNVPQKTQEVITVARQVTEERMGLKVGRIQVRLDHAHKVQKQKINGGRDTKQLQSPQQPQTPG